MGKRRTVVCGFGFLLLSGCVSDQELRQQASGMSDQARDRACTAALIEEVRNCNNQADPVPAVAFVNGYNCGTSKRRAQAFCY